MALILSRKEFQSVVLYPYPEGDDRQIVVTVEQIGNGQVKLSFAAPEGVDIWRDELLEGE